MSALIREFDAHCLFCKIAAGQIPSKIVYQDDELFVFHDIHPWAPVHFLMIPKLHIPSMAQLGPEHAGLMGRMMVLAPQLALQQGCSPYPDGGFRMLSNTGAEGRQEVQHLHVHVMGGPRPWLRG
ncbi:histidine triad nucleotide-binding protein [Rhodoferax sp.]|uniref:histidine triad nucleotide-binding protein n=1 Tax=Rhodoferax sp. TaxID=50421 RepID=UPI00277371C1|nr:histidine triad nucleotide-binding protein [Rhodoferax sp.]